MRRARRACSHSATAIKLTTAENDIWKPGSSRFSGRNIRMIVAARPNERIDSAGRSNRTASSMVASITKARVAGVAAPLMTR